MLRPRITEEIPLRIPVPYKLILHPLRRGERKLNGAKLVTADCDGCTCGTRSRSPGAASWAEARSNSCTYIGIDIYMASCYCHSVWGARPCVSNGTKQESAEPAQAQYSF